MILLLSLMAYELLAVTLSPNPIMVFNSIFFRQSLITVVLLWMMMLTRLSLYALVNAQLSLHR
jgi:hypothetical protein